MEGLMSENTWIVMILLFWLVTMAFDKSDKD